MKAFPCRFSKAERDTLKQAAVNYAQERGLSDTDFGWLYETRRGPQRKLTIGAWKVIAESLPNRSIAAVWRTGTRILHPDNRKVRTPYLPAFLLRCLIRHAQCTCKSDLARQGYSCTLYG